MKLLILVSTGDTQASTNNDLKEIKSAAEKLSVLQLGKSGIFPSFEGAEKEAAIILAERLNLDVLETIQMKWGKDERKKRCAELVVNFVSEKYQYEKFDSVILVSGSTQLKHIARSIDANQPLPLYLKYGEMLIIDKETKKVYYINKYAPHTHHQIKSRQ
ncbi:MAG TPA: hypothetical protein VL576_00865 [Candidatus Paceibacterota bacterium]|jgi:hypothetical protein|nr:hypothetical protein [Candidatus Paceibacterota bacterium]